MNSNEPAEVWYLNPIGAISTEVPQVPANMTENESEAPPSIPPLPPPAQLGPPKAHASYVCWLGKLAPSEALIIPPSAASEKLIPVAFGSMPNPNAVRRSLAKSAALFR